MTMKILKRAKVKGQAALRISDLLAAVVLKHWTDDGTGITNFDKPKLAKYGKAIKAYGDTNMVVVDEPMPAGNTSCRKWMKETMHSLHRLNGQTDLSEFWRIFRGKKAANTQDLPRLRRSYQ